MFTLYIEDIHGGQTHEHSFGEGELVVGRSREKCDIVLPADNVSRRHARLYTADNRCYVQDLQSSNGVLVDGVRIRDVRELEPSSRVRIGDYVLFVTSDDAPQSAAPSDYGKLIGGAEAGGQTFTLREAVSLVGRGKDTAITVIDPSISRIHAKLTITQAGDYVLQDLKSSNGTYVNDQRIEQTVLAHGDRLRFGNIEFRFEGTSEMAARAVDRPTAGPGDVASPAMPIPRAAGWESVPAGPGVPLDDSAEIAQAMPGAGKRWLVLGVIVTLLLAVAAAAVVFLTRGSSEPDPAVAKAIASAKTEAAEQMERRERRERRRAEQIEEELETARGLIAQRKWNEAKVALDIAVELDPTSEIAVRLRAVIAKELPNAEAFDTARSAREARDFAKALRAFAKVPESSVYRDDAQAAVAEIRGERERILEQAEAAVGEKDWEMAVKRYEEALAIDADDPETEKRLDRAKKRIRR